MTRFPIPFFPGAFLGNQRSAASGLAIAVDPRDSDIVYVAWAQGTNAANYSLHLRRSTDRGRHWSGDLRVINRAMNPTLAINDRGEVGFFYQKFHNPGTGNRWQNQLELSHDGFATSTNIILADTPDINGPGPTLNPNNPIGDYAGLVTVGRTFYGIFSANNTPDLANFPNGVKYQRNANFAGKQLLDLGGLPVPESYDPFFYRIFWKKEEEGHEPEEGEGKCECLELKGLKWERIEIKELKLALKDPRARGHHQKHDHKESHERGALVRRLGEEIEELGRRIADSVDDDDRE